MQIFAQAAPFYFHSVDRFGPISAWAMAVSGVVIVKSTERRRQVFRLSGWPRSRRPKNHTEGAPGPSLLGTGETPDLNWQEEAHGLAGLVPINAPGFGNILTTKALLLSRLKIGIKTMMQLTFQIDPDEVGTENRINPVAECTTCLEIRFRKKNDVSLPDSARKQSYAQEPFDSV